MFSVAPGVRAVIAASVLAAVVSPAAAQPAGPLVPGLTPEQIQASQALAPKFDRSAEMEQARQTTFKDRPLGAIVQKSFNAFANYLIVSAQMMPEPGYAFRPTPDVRTFGEQINHATGANYSFCNQAGVPPGFDRRSAPGLQAATSKAAIVGALEASIALLEPDCGRERRLADGIGAESRRCRERRDYRLARLRVHIRRHS